MNGYEPDILVYPEVWEEEDPVLSMSQTRYYNIDGEAKTLPKLASERGLNISTVRRRLRTGYDIREALTPGIMPPRRDLGSPTETSLLTQRGRTMTLNEWSKETGIPLSTILYRAEQGYPPEKVITRRMPHYASNAIFDLENLRYAGKCQSIEEWQAEVGTRKGLIYNRLMRGHSLEEALFQGNIGGFICHQGKCLTPEEWQAELGISQEVIRLRQWKRLPVEDILYPGKLECESGPEASANVKIGLFSRFRRYRA